MTHMHMYVHCTCYRINIKWSMISIDMLCIHNSSSFNPTRMNMIITIIIQYLNYIHPSCTCFIHVARASEEGSDREVSLWTKWTAWTRSSWSPKILLMCLFFIFFKFCIHQILLMSRIIFGGNWNILHSSYDIVQNSPGVGCVL